MFSLRFKYRFGNSSTPTERSHSWMGGAASGVQRLTPIPCLAGTPCIGGNANTRARVFRRCWCSSRELCCHFDRSPVGALRWFPDATRLHRSHQRHVGVAKVTSLRVCSRRRGQRPETARDPSGLRRRLAAPERGPATTKITERDGLQRGLARASRRGTRACRWARPVGRSPAAATASSRSRSRRAKRRKHECGRRLFRTLQNSNWRTTESGLRGFDVINQWASGAVRAARDLDGGHGSIQFGIKAVRYRW